MYVRMQIQDTIMKKRTVSTVIRTTNLRTLIEQEKKTICQKTYPKETLRVHFYMKTYKLSINYNMLYPARANYSPFSGFFIIRRG